MIPIKYLLKSISIAIPFKSFLGEEVEVKKLQINDASIVHDIKILPNPLIVPSMSAKIDRTCCTVNFNNLKINSEVGDVSGGIAIDFTKNLIINADLSSDTIRYTEVESSSKLEFDRLLAATGAIKWDINKFYFKDNLITNTKLVVNLGEDLTTIAHTGKIFSGTNLTKIDVRANNNLSIESKFNDVSIADWLAGSRHNISASGGYGNLTIAASTSGSNSRQLLSNLNGDIRASGKNLTLHNTEVKTSLLGVLASRITNIIPNSKNTVVQCMELKTAIESGSIVLDKGFGFETDSFAGLVSGVISIPREDLKLDLRILPKPKLADMPSTDQLVHIEGSIHNPKVSINPQGTVKEGGSIILGIATAGVSLLTEKLFELVAHDGKVCDKVANSSQN